MGECRVRWEHGGEAGLAAQERGGAWLGDGEATWGELPECQETFPVSPGSLCSRAGVSRHEHRGQKHRGPRNQSPDGSDHI